MRRSRLEILARRAARAILRRPPPPVQPNLPVHGLATWLENAPFKPACEMERIFTSHPGRAIHKWKHYLEIYERHFAPYRAAATKASPVRLLEIGVARGGSLQMWRTYFGPDAVIAGMDLNPTFAPMAKEGFIMEVGDQTSEADLKRVVERMAGVDIVIDDGGHHAHQQLKSFEILFPILSPYGLYCCEDLHTSYWDEFAGGLRRPGTFIEFTKDLIDRLHLWYMQPGTMDDPFAIKDTVFAIHTYDSMVMIEKRPRERPYDLLTKAPDPDEWSS